jgi:hypothetical protein
LSQYLRDFCHFGNPDKKLMINKSERIMNPNDPLLTQEEKIARIKELLPKEKRGQFFIPDDIFYSKPIDDEGLKIMAKQLAAWMGFKPTALRIHFSHQLKVASMFEVNEDGAVIFIHSRYSLNPFASASLLSFRLVQYYLEYRKHVKLTDISEQQTLIMLGVVYSGLGLVALNSVTSYWQEHYPRLYFLLHSFGHESSSRTINTYMVQQFSEDYGLDFKDFSKYICPWAKPYLPKHQQSSGDSAGFVRSARLKSKNAYGALVGSLVVVVLGMALSGYVLQQRPHKLTKAMQEQKEEIDLLKESYDICNTAVSSKQQAYNHQDIFIERNIEADKVRCTSIRNTYNNEVDQFNAKLR